MYPQGSAVVLKYSHSSHIFSDWRRDGAVGGEACCSLNYSAGSNEQIFMLLNVPDMDMNIHRPALFYV